MIPGEKEINCFRVNGKREKQTNLNGPMPLSETQEMGPNGGKRKSQYMGIGHSQTTHLWREERISKQKGVRDELSHLMGNIQTHFLSKYESLRPNVRLLWLSPRHIFAYKIWTNAIHVCDKKKLKTLIFNSIYYPYLFYGFNRFALCRLFPSQLPKRIPPDESNGVSFPQESLRSWHCWCQGKCQF
jgi:hypothetical protein